MLKPRTCAQAIMQLLYEHPENPRATYEEIRKRLRGGPDSPDRDDDLTSSFGWHGMTIDAAISSLMKRGFITRTSRAQYSLTFDGLKRMEQNWRV